MRPPCHGKVFLSLLRNKYAWGTDSLCIGELAVKVDIRKHWGQFWKSQKTAQPSQKHKSEQQKKKVHVLPFIKKIAQIEQKAKRFANGISANSAETFSLVRVALISHLWSSFTMFCKSSHKTLFYSLFIPRKLLIAAVGVRERRAA